MPEVRRAGVIGSTRGGAENCAAGRGRCVVTGLTGPVTTAPTREKLEPVGCPDHQTTALSKIEAIETTRSQGLVVTRVASARRCCKWSWAATSSSLSLGGQPTTHACRGGGSSDTTASPNSIGTPAAKSARAIAGVPLPGSTYVRAISQTSNSAIAVVRKTESCFVGPVLNRPRRSAPIGDINVPFLKNEARQEFVLTHADVERRHTSVGGYKPRRRSTMAAGKLSPNTTVP